ncbi:MAG: hypothetical protein EA399_17710 [Desulfovibrionales bacterium]|nr:MAG: hypothetical protein EA399_17710 [Desulfovibrionales bacterium]
MPIIISNMGSPNRIEGEDPGGLRRYEVKINTELIATFDHCRRDGLAVCLRLAAEAVDAANKQQKVKLKFL